MTFVFMASMPATREAMVEASTFLNGDLSEMDSISGFEELPIFLSYGETPLASSGLLLDGASDFLSNEFLGATASPSLVGLCEFGLVLIYATLWGLESVSKYIGLLLQCGALSVLSLSMRR